MLADLVGQQGSALLVRERREQRGLAAGTRAEVGPATGVLRDLGTGQHTGHELRARVLDAHHSLAGAGHAVDVSPAADGAAGYEVPRVRAGLQCGVERAEARQGHEVHARRLVVGGQQIRDLLGVPTVGPQRAAQRTDLPHGVRVADAHPPPLVRLLALECLEPLLLGAPGHLAQHRVDEPGRTLPDLTAHEPHGGVQGRVVGHAHGQQLVGAQPQGVQHRGVQLLQRAVHAPGQDGVPRAAPAHGAVGQFRGERGVPLVEAQLPDQAGQHQVAVGVLGVHRAQRPERRQPRRIGVATPLARGLRGVGPFVLGTPVALVALGVAAGATRPRPALSLPVRAVAGADRGAGRSATPVPRSAPWVPGPTLVGAAAGAEGVPRRPGAVLTAAGAASTGPSWTVPAVLLPTLSVGAAVLTHTNATCSMCCLPRAQSRAAMGFLPAGCTRVSSTA